VDCKGGDCSLLINSAQASEHILGNITLEQVLKNTNLENNLLVCIKLGDNKPEAKSADVK